MAAMGVDKTPDQFDEQTPDQCADQSPDQSPSQSSDQSSESSSSYSSVILIDEQGEWDNFLENFSDPQHLEQPKLLQPNEGNNYYMSLDQRDWNREIAGAKLSFAANNTSFMQPLQYQELDFCTGFVTHSNIYGNSHDTPIHHHIIYNICPY